MPNCRTCNPTCQRCHRKPGFVLPVECPQCGRFNPSDRELCLKCGTPVPQKKDGAQQGIAASTKRACFQCDPLTRPLCKDCVEKGRIKICPACKGYVLGTRRDCKACGFAFEEPTVS